MISDKKVSEFISDLGSESLTPGAGSTVALVGSLSTALAKMTCNTTLRKGENEEVTTYLNELEQLKEDLNNLIAEDIKAYKGVVAAYKKGDRELVNEKMIIATDVPLKIMKKVIRVLEITVELMGLINYTALGEMGTAVFLAKAVADSVGLMVDINLKLITTEEYKQKAGRLSSNRLEHSQQLKQKALAKLRKRRQEN